jgi:hypothetical protein
MCAKLFVKAQIIALAEQVEVVFGEYRRKTIGVFQLDLIVAEPGAQPIAF